MLFVISRGFFFLKLDAEKKRNTFKLKNLVHPHDRSSQKFSRKQYRNWDTGYGSDIK